MFHFFLFARLDFFPSLKANILAVELFRVEVQVNTVSNNANGNLTVAFFLVILCIILRCTIIHHVI